MTAPSSPASAPVDNRRVGWLAGYTWALSHLTDPGVLRDAARFADERGGCSSVDPGLTAPVEERKDTCLASSPRTGPREAGHHNVRTFGDDGNAPDTCMCTCAHCWDDHLDGGMGRCLCSDCRNPHHDHRGRATSEPEAERP